MPACDFVNVKRYTAAVPTINNSPRFYYPPPRLLVCCLFVCLGVVVCLVRSGLLLRESCGSLTTAIPDSFPGVLWGLRPSADPDVVGVASQFKGAQHPQCNDYDGGQ